jgi:hypothetical protein
MSTSARKPVSVEGRRIIAAALLIQRESGEPGTWRQIWRRAGISNPKRGYRKTLRLLDRGYIKSGSAPHSIRVTPAGRAAALSGFHEGPTRTLRPQIASNSAAALPVKATEVARDSFTSTVTRRAGQGVSLEGGGATMDARTKSFVQAARAAGFTAVEAPNKKATRFALRGQRKAGRSARLWRPL